ncbi:MAG: preprotein translocase subunit YajC [Oscillospiraceae bacterium]|nr:preprotein translocase subunit YajC [Oscillospiraceae bacterium]
MIDIHFLEAAAAPAGDPMSAIPGGGAGIMVFYIILMVGALALFSLPQKKQEKKQKAMRDSIRVGDEVTTIGGIIGIVISRDNDHDCVVIETGGNRSKIRLKLSAISENLTVHDEEDELGKKK